MFRTRFAKEIVCEFLPPARKRKKDRVIILCDGMPGIPRKKSLVQFLSRQGYWVFYPRYRGSWESEGEFLARSPHEDVLDAISALHKPITELAFGRKFELNAHEIFVVGGSFGGAVAILCSLDARVKRVVANCPVVDWSILRQEEKTETNKPYPVYLREAFGNAYRMKARNWNKLYSGKFFNPAHHADEIDAAKILMYHAKDDPHVPTSSVEKFAQRTGAKLRLFARGGHLKTEFVVTKYWKEITAFFEK
jgi:pimeloyl-ACP methyl ester carboxylesterase